MAFSNPDVSSSYAVLPVASVIDKGQREDRLAFITGGSIHVRCSFALSEEEKAKIELMVIGVTFPLRYVFQISGAIEATT